MDNQTREVNNGQGFTPIIYKAQAVTGTDKVPDLNIQATEEFPDFTGPDWRQVSAAAHESAAEEIVRKLEASLPGGTFDAILRRLLTRRASKLIVPSRQTP